MRNLLPRSIFAAAIAWALSSSAGVAGQASAAKQVTFTRNIAPILQRSCQSCHRPDSIAQMSLITYAEVRPWAASIKRRTALRNRQGVMPPWYIEKDIGIQRYKNDVSLSDAEIATIAAWVDSGAPQGNPADLPPPLKFTDGNAWSIGEPDLIVKTPPVSMKAVSPDWWGNAGFGETNLTEDRYVAAVEIKEVTDARGEGNGSTTVGGLFIFHHALMSVQGPSDSIPTGPAAAAGALSGGWPIHEVGRNADVFNPDAGKLLRAGGT